MSKKSGFSLCYRNDSFVAMSVSAMAPGQWRIDKVDDKVDGAATSALALDFGKNSDRVTMMIPGTSVRTALMSLPRLKKKETNQAVHGWVAREESTPADQWRISWRERKSSGEEKSDKKDIFLIYAPREEVENQLASAETWGAVPTRMLPDFMILDAMFRRHHPEASSLEAWNIVFVGEDEHFLCVSTKASLLLTRPLPGDLSSGSDAGEYIQRLATEVDRSVFFARQTEFNPDIQKIIVCGNPELAKGLVNRLQEETTVAAEFWDIAELFQWEGENLDSRNLLPAMAAALATQKNPFNLLPGQSRSLLGPLMRRRLVLAASTAAVAALPILIAGGFFTARVQDHYLDRARVQMQQASIRADEAAQIYKSQRVLVAREGLIRSFTEKDTDYAGVLLHLANLTPEKIIFQDLRLKESSEGELVLNLSGESNATTVAEAQESFLIFQQALNASPQLVAAGEPRKLLISSPAQKKSKVKRVEFSMEYRVQNDNQPTGGVASVMTGTER